MVLLNYHIYMLINQKIKKHFLYQNVNIQHVIMKQVKIVQNVEHVIVVKNVKKQIGQIIKKFVS